MYRVEIKAKARKDVLALPKEEQRRVVAAFEILRENPFAGKKLHGKYDGAWSLRIWP